MTKGDLINDYILAPSRYLAGTDQAEVLPLEEALVLLAEAEEERAATDRELDAVLSRLGLEGWRRG